MTDLPVPDYAGQPCFGPAGHIRVTSTDDDARHPRYDLVPNYPGIVLAALAAPIGQPCIGTFAHVDEPGGSVHHHHAHFIVVGFNPTRPQWPKAFVGAFRDRSGVGHDEIRGCDGLPADDAGRLIQAWQAVRASGRVTLRGGRPLWAASYFGDPEIAAQWIREAIEAGAWTREEILDWLAGNRDPRFGNSAESRLSEWYKAATGMRFKDFRANVRETSPEVSVIRTRPGTDETKKD
jgi:hypothetical protein